MADLAGECFEQVSDHLQAACDLIARCWGAKSWPVRRRGDRIGNREAERLGCLVDGRPQGAAVTFPSALKAAHFKFARWPRELMRLSVIVGNSIRQVKSNRAMRCLQPDLVGSDRIVPVASVSASRS